MRRILAKAEPALASGKFAGVCDFALTDRTDVRRLQGYNGGGRAVQSGELHLVGKAIPIDVHDDADVARFEALCRNRHSQNHALMFLNHARLLFVRICRDKTRRIRSLINNPTLFFHIDLRVNLRFL